jgi:mannose/fructose/N-acetylgalactosamine-specific phosphotransferase system component IIB
MSVVLYRIDDRLIHGQIMTAWSKVTKANRILVIDNLMAQDPFMQKVLTMAAPRDLKVEICNLENGLNVLKNDVEGPNDKTLVLVKTPQVIEYLVSNGVSIKLLNVGGMGAGANRKSIFKNISASTEEIATLKKIHDMGVEIEFRIVPDDKCVPLNKIFK